MLKKKIAAIITTATKVCSKCGRTIVGNSTICKCGKVIYNAKNDNKIDGETAL